MREAKKHLSGVLEVALSLFVLNGLVFGQAKMTTIEVDAGRPLAEAVLVIEQLSGIPINYEDVRYQHPDDLKDVTDAVMRPEQRAVAGPDARVIVPRGGKLSAPISVDAATGQLLDIGAVTGALHALLTANRSKNFPGDYDLETYNGAFFVKPTQVRDASGATVTATPVLTAPISFAPQQRNAAVTLELILDQVSKTTGFRIGVGMVPINALVPSQVTVGANREPAHHVLAKFLASIPSRGAADPAVVPKMSYRLLYDPQLKYYMFNVHIVPNPNPKPAPPNPQPPPQSTSDRFFEKDP